MKQQRTLRRAVIAAMLLMAFLGQGTWALAGVTGNIAGVIKDSSGAPVAGVEVQAISASMNRTATTDAGGHFVLLSLNPDTYTINVSKIGIPRRLVPGRGGLRRPDANGRLHAAAGAAHDRARYVGVPVRRS